MNSTHQIGEDPLPGYRLLAPLGSGAFGEVWKSSAPGGTEVALKFIRLDGDHGLREVKSLELVKTIRHPNLCTIFALWARDANGNVLEDDSVDLKGLADTKKPKATDETLLATDELVQKRPVELVIAMALGEKTLADRLNEVRSEGFDGIPPEELFEYMEAAARAIDHLNSPRHDLGEGLQAIQHCDIKPQNILIVGDTAQVCDFGIARRLGNRQMTQQGGLSLYWAAPELFDKQPSASTDQYSLALTYFHARTGRLPFVDAENATELQIMRAHTTGRLDLSSLPEDEQAVIARATSLEPEQRYDKTIDMIRALRRAYEGAARRHSTVQRSFAEAGMEIVPGYQLVRRIAGSAGVDAWEATDDKGNPCAVLVRPLSPPRDVVDLEALEHISKIKNPHLTSMRGYWLLDKNRQVIASGKMATAVKQSLGKTLVIAGLLAPKNLLQRLEECRRTTGPGIPGEELGGHLKAIASGLDALNSPHDDGRGNTVSVQHCNLRPTNILLFDDGLRIGNFALARILKGESATLEETAALLDQPFCAPELAEGRLTPWSDQYSFAISYVQLRTGSSPFDAAASTTDLVQDKQRGILRLDDLGKEEGQVVARATSTAPDQRFPNCQAFVDALEQARLNDRAARTLATGPEGHPTRMHTTVAGSLEFDPKSDRTQVYVERQSDDTLKDPAVSRDTDSPSPATAPSLAPTLEPSIATTRKLPVKWIVGGAAGILVAALLLGVWGAQRSASSLANRVQTLVAEHEYVAAGDAIRETGPLQSVFVDTADLQQSVVEAALDDVNSLIEQEEFAAAFKVCDQLKQVDPSGDSDTIAEDVRSRGVTAGQARVRRQQFAEAAVICRQLTEQYPRDAEVTGLGIDVLSQGILFTQGLLEEVPVPAEDLLLAGKLNAEFNLLASEIKQSVRTPGVAEAVEKARSLRGKIVRQGADTVHLHLEQSLIGSAVAAVDSLRVYFADDSLVVPLDDEVATTGVQLAEAQIDSGSMTDATILLGELLPWSSRFERIDALDQQCYESFRHRLAEGQWNEAIEQYQALSAVAPDEPRTSDYSNELFSTAIKKIESQVSAGELDRAETLRVTLFNAFGDDPRVRQLQDVLIKQVIASAETSAENGRTGDAARTLSWLNRRFSDDPRVTKLATEMSELLGDRVDSMSPTESVETLLQGMHARIDQARIDEARDNYHNAESFLSSVDDPAKLASRMSLALARIESNSSNWAEAQAALDETDVELLDNQERGLYLALQAIVTAGATEANIPADFELAATTEHLLNLQTESPEFTSQTWFQGEAALAKLLVRDIASRTFSEVGSGSLSSTEASQQLAAVASLESLLTEQDQRAIAAKRIPAAVCVTLLDEQTTAEDAIAALEELQSQELGLTTLSGLGLVQVAELLARRSDLVASTQLMDEALNYCELVRAERPAISRDMGPPYASLLAQQIVQLANTPEEPDWAALRQTSEKADERIKSIGGGSAHALVQAILAESLVAPEGPVSAADWKAANDLIESAELTGTDEPWDSYLTYVKGLVLAATPRGGDLSPAATRMLAAFDGDSPGEMLAASYRRSHGAKVLLQAATQKTKWDATTPATLDVLRDPLPVARTADVVFPWLEKARDLSSDEEANPTLRLNLAAAAFYSEEQQLDLVDQLTQQLLEDSEESAELLVLRAQALQGTDPQAAMLLYDRALQRIQDHPEFISGATYRRLLRPALDASPLPEVDATPEEARQAIARLLAAKATLLRNDAETARSVEEPKQAEFEAYDAAVAYDPNNADYRIHRGLVRFDRPGRTNEQKLADVTTALEEDLKPVIELSGDTPPAGAYFLNARIQYVRSSSDSSISREERTKRLAAAMQYYEQAAQTGELRGDDQANCLIGASTTNVSLANYTVGDRAQQRTYLENACKWAEEAAKINPRPHPEYAYQALGNAEEDFGWLLAEFERYCAAISAFEAATIAADNAGLPSAQSLLNTGRCRYKMLNVWSAFEGCGVERGEEIRRGMSDLQRAIDSGQLDAASQAKALSWQAKIQVLDSNYDEAERLQQLAVETADSASPEWATHQIDWAQIAAAHALYLKYRKRPAEEVNAKYDLARSRAAALLEDGGTATDIDRQRATMFIATCHANQSNPTDALKTLRDALPDDLKDADDTHLGLLVALSRQISSDAALWPENRDLCEDSARRAVEIAAAAGESYHEAQAWAAGGLHAVLKYRINPTRATAEAVRLQFEKALELEDRLNETWYWRYQLARIYADMISNSTLFSGDTKSLAKQAVELLEPLTGSEATYVQPTIRQAVDQLLPKLRQAAAS